MNANELKRIAAAVEKVIGEGKRGLLLTVAGTAGSTYRRAGARAVIVEDGETIGLISGGCLERDLALRARGWLDDLRPRVVTYDTTKDGDVLFGMGVGCRGTTEILVQPFDSAHRPLLPPLAMTSPVIHATVIHSNDLARETGDVLKVERRFDRTCRTIIGECDVLVEVIAPARAVVLFGGGQDVEPVAALGRALGWRVDVVSPRMVHPDAVRTSVDLSRYEAAVVMTHNFLYDQVLLEALFASPVGFIGLLGPKSRGDELLQALGNVTEAQRHRFHSPIGLDLGGESPEEIALAIVAEIQAELNGRAAAPLSRKDGPIHDRAEAPVKVAR